MTGDCVEGLKVATPSPPPPEATEERPSVCFFVVGTSLFAKSLCGAWAWKELAQTGCWQEMTPASAAPRKPGVKPDAKAAPRRTHVYVPMRKPTSSCSQTNAWRSRGPLLRRFSRPQRQASYGHAFVCSAKRARTAGSKLLACTLKGRCGLPYVLENLMWSLRRRGQS